MIYLTAKQARWCVMCWTWVRLLQDDGKTCSGCWNMTMSKEDKKKADNEEKGAN